MAFLFRLLFRLIGLGLVVALLAAGGFLYWAQRPLAMPSNEVEFRVPAGSSLRGAVGQIQASGIELTAWPFIALARLEGSARQIKAGTYAASLGMTPRSLLQMLAEGRVVQRDITLVEGWTFRQFRARMDAHPDLQHDTQGLTEAEIIAKLGLPLSSLEGWLFPDTYLFDKQSSDLELIARAVRAMQRRLDAAWANRPSGLPYKTPYEALIMASIIEKETGLASDRAMVASVFVNRLRIGMRLQTDPTVIYGLGEQFDGNLRKRDLLADTPYNSYTRAGLPPTPIAMPGEAALRAAFEPAASSALYFVARGDGSSHFSSSLDEHNRAVNRYQRGQN